MTRTITADHAERLPRVSGVLNFGVIWLTEMRGAECAREFRGSGCIRDLERVCSARAHEGHSLPVILSASAAGAVCEPLLRAPA